jgi:hypothetical protein
MTNEARTANEMIIAVGQEVLVQFESLRVQCVVRDVKKQLRESSHFRCANFW